MRINEIFKSIQGEGRYTGTPMLFIRLSGCNLDCDFCDTKYHKEVNIELDIEELKEEIKKTGIKNVCFTGGEPLIQWNEIKKIIEDLKDFNFHLETNGTFLTEEIINKFFHCSVSPKNEDDLEKVIKLLDNDFETTIDIKLVVDENNINEYERYYSIDNIMLMPLSGKGEKKDLNNMMFVWDYCTKNNIKFCGRLHYLIFKNKKGV